MCLVLLLQQLEHIFCADICHNTTTIKYLGVAALFGVCRDTEVCCLCYNQQGISK